MPHRCGLSPGCGFGASPGPGTQLAPAGEAVAAEVRTLGEDRAEVLCPRCVFGKVLVSVSETSAWLSCASLIHTDIRAYTCTLTWDPGSPAVAATQAHGGRGHGHLEEPAPPLS